MQKVLGWIRNRRSVWGIVAAAAYVLGAAIAFTSAVRLIDGGTTQTALVSVLTTYVIIALLVSGVGQLMRAAAHGAISRGGKRIDGWGKTIGLFGWSLGLVGAVAFSVVDTETPSWVVGATVLAVILPAAVTLSWSMLPALKSDEQPRSPGAAG